MLRIGISSCYFHSDPLRPIFKGKTLLYLEQSLAHWVMQQGALAVLIPSAPAQGRIRLSDFAKELDGLVLQGGSDVAPQSYGETPLKPEWSGDFIRDQYELELVREFRAERKPILGICRGAQLLNIAFGGTLYQDISTQVPRALDHRNWELYDQNFHSISIEPGSELSRLYPGVKKAKINTIHHQAIRDLGKGLVVEARSEQDGLVEAIRIESPPDEFVYATQWHPEFHDISDSSLLDGRPLLERFLLFATKRKSTESP